MYLYTTTSQCAICCTDGWILHIQIVKKQDEPSRERVVKEGYLACHLVTTAAAFLTVFCVST